MRLSISQAQDLLSGLGYKPGPSCGSLTDPTRKALSRFQLDEHILTTGVLDTLTEEKLITRAQVEGVGEKFPWWVWAGIVVGSGIIVWGVWRWVDGTKKLKDAKARERMLSLVNEYDQGPVSVRALNAPRASTADFEAYQGPKAVRALEAPYYGEKVSPSMEAAIAEAADRLMRPPTSSGEGDDLDSASSVAGAATLPHVQAWAPDWRKREVQRKLEDLEPSTVVEPPVPATDRQAALSGFGPKRASVAAMVKLDAKAQQLAYDRWSSAMKGLGEPRDYNDDYVRNMAPVNERIRMDEPDGEAAYDATVAEFIRTDVQKADPKAQARFRKYVDIYRKQLMRKKFGE